MQLSTALPIYEEYDTILLMDNNIAEQQLNLPEKKGLTTNALKIIAIVAMTIDHLAIVFFEQLFPSTETWSIVVWQILRAIGRLTIVIMCYMTADGFFYTRNIKKYLLRLLIFALISHFPYAFFHSGHWFFTEVDPNKFQTSVIWPIFLGVLNLHIWTNQKLKLWLRIVLFAVILGLAIPSDWNVIAVLWIFCFYIFRRDKRKQIVSFLVIGFFAAVVPIVVAFFPADMPILSMFSVDYEWYEKIFMLGVILSTPILLVYNGKLGKSKKLKWLFYIYYPAHLIVLGLVILLCK